METGSATEEAKNIISRARKREKHMKKSVLMAIAAFAMIFTACGNKSAAPAEGDNDKDAPATEVKGTKFEGANFALTYPEALKETYSSDEMINAGNDMGPAISELKTYLDNYASVLMKDAKMEDSNIDGKTLTAKFVKEDGSVNMHFVVMKEDKIGVSGSLKCNKDKEEEAKGYVDSIIKSITFK